MDKQNRKKGKGLTNQVAPDNKKQKSKKREAIEYIAVIIFGVLLALFVRFNIGQLFLVDGQSMEPTFQHHDFAVSSIISYKKHKPKIGDVVIVQADQINEKIIKRVVGTEGDTIEVKDGMLIRNGKKIKEPYIKEKMVDDFGPVTVPNGEIFVMGDNRNHSGDSRIFGTFPLEKVKSKVVFELWDNPFKTY